jgi:hypothetical protein
MNFDNILPSDRNFISSDDLDYTLYDDYANKLVMNKFKTYVDTWYQNNIDKLKDLAGNKEMLLKCKKMVVDGLSEEEATVVMNTDYDSATHPENTSAPIPGNFDTPNTGEAIGTPEVPKVNIGLPEGFSVNDEDLARLSEFNNQEGSHIIMSPEELIKHEEERITESTTPVVTPSTTETPAVPPIPPIPVPPVVTPTTETTTPSTESEAQPTVPSIPPLPSNFEVNEDELNSLTEEERAAMAAAENE